MYTFLFFNYALSNMLRCLVKNELFCNMHRVVRKCTKSSIYVFQSTFYWFFFTQVLSECHRYQHATSALTDLVIHTFLFVLWSYCLCCLYCRVWRREAVSVISAEKSSHRQQNCFIRTYWGILPIVHIYTQYFLRIDNDIVINERRFFLLWFFKFFFQIFKFQLIENVVICFVLPVVQIKFILCVQLEKNDFAYSLDK